MENKIEVDVPHIIKELDKEIKEYIEEGYSYAETLLQIGICTSLAACLINFDIFTVAYIATVISMCLVIYFILDYYKKLLKQLDKNYKTLIKMNKPQEQTNIDLLGIKDYVKTETEKINASSEMFLQLGICCSLATLVVAPCFNIFTVLFVASYMILTVALFGKLNHYKNLLKQLEEDEFDGSELGI